jgi:hypothetical protein
LQDALSTATSGKDIWVAAGTYNPSELINPEDPRSATFLLKEGVRIYGGFSGNGTETHLSQRNFKENIVLLSGDLNGDDIENDFISNKSDNVYHVVTGATGATIDGISIKYGYANPDDPDNNYYLTQGGGMFTLSASPTVVNTIFSNNFALYYGGGMVNVNSSFAIITNVAFINNSAGNGGGMCDAFSSSTITNAIFANNFADSRGAGLYKFGTSNPNISAFITNATFVNNAGQEGGGFYNFKSNVTIRNSIFRGNTAPIGSNIINGSAFNMGFSNVEGGFDGIQKYRDINDLSGTTITDSDGFAAAGNIDADPLFLSPSDPDGEDDILMTADDGLSLKELPDLSPSIDSGTGDGAPATDITGGSRPKRNGFDMGAYEF